VTFLVGLDIGQRGDYTALAVLDEAENRDLTLVALERIRHLPYPEVAQLVADTVAALSDVTLLVDCTGVGRPVTDQLVALGVRHTRINIHGGNAVTRLDDGTISVPKRDLISALAVRFEARTLRIVGNLPHAGTLETEAAAFRMKVSASGHDSYSAREGEHDDLLLAVSLPVWWIGTRPPKPASASADAPPGFHNVDRRAVLAGARLAAAHRRRLI
jgi:hypothetical protein